MAEESSQTVWQVEKTSSWPYAAAHADIELAWWETFVEMVADLVGGFPHAAEAAQAEEGIEAVEPNMMANYVVDKELR